MIKRSFLSKKTRIYIYYVKFTSTKIRIPWNFLKISMRTLEQPSISCSRTRKKNEFPLKVRKLTKKVVLIPLLFDENTEHQRRGRALEDRRWKILSKAPNSLIHKLAEQLRYRWKQVGWAWRGFEQWFRSAGVFQGPFVLHLFSFRILLRIFRSTKAEGRSSTALNLARLYETQGNCWQSPRKRAGKEGSRIEKHFTAGRRQSERQFCTMALERCTEKSV